MVATSPRVSIVMPAHDAAPYVGAAIGAILAQRFADLELVVVDDGSRDETAAEACRAIGLDSRGWVLRQENLGEAGARDAGLAATTAPLVAMTDADDLWYPERSEERR